MGPNVLLETKFYLPQSRSGAVSRPRLRERLDRGSGAKLMLVSAPAGFGKTTLLTEWLASQPAAPIDERLAAWLSVDGGDNDPASFWTYVIAALRTVAPEVGGRALALLEAPQAPPIETVLSTLINDLSALTSDIVLVLDDYHAIEARQVHEAMAFLLEHLPPRLHLVIASRADPALPLARLRARGELVETRAAELRFTPDEAAEYLNEMMGLQLTANDVAALEGRTEGWIAALQLAALSMQGRDDVAGFIAGFAGDDRYIVDYLVEEVLERQPDDMRRFLVQTSVLDRLTGPLCDAVTGQQGGRAMLEALDRANLFVVPLDDNRRWYRYHHLFADVLQTHLLEERPDEAPDLHRRASRWYSQNGEPAPAIRHALATDDFERAADLVELAIPAMLRARQEATIRGWLDLIPDDIVRVRPVLAIGFVGTLMSGGEFEGVEARLEDVERLLNAAADDGGDELARLPAAIEMYRAALALVRGDLSATAGHAQRAIDSAAADDHLVRAGAAALSGLAFWSAGDLQAAHRAYSVSLDGLQRAGNISDVLGCSIAVSDIRCTQGRLDDALRTYEKALQLASREAGPVLRGTADMYVGLSQIACERDDLSTATQHLQHARELGEHTWLPQNPYRWRVAMARVRQAEGDLDGALDLLDDAQRVYVGDFSPNVRPVPASRARVLVAQGRLGDALAWAREHGLSAKDDLSYLQEFEHITLARVLLAQVAAEPSQPRTREVAELLERLLAAAEAGERTGSVIEILVLQALAHQVRGDGPGALAPLGRALTLAEPERYVRVFVGEGPPMATLLRTVAKQRSAWGYVRRLLGHNPAVSQTLVERLSERELQVLRLLGSDLDGPSIARHLMVSLNTVRTHTKNIYAKLGVTSRRAAVRRAAELDLL